MKSSVTYSVQSHPTTQSLRINEEPSQNHNAVTNIGNKNANIVLTASTVEEGVKVEDIPKLSSSLDLPGLGSKDSPIDNASIMNMVASSDTKHTPQVATQETEISSPLSEDKHGNSGKIVTTIVTSNPANDEPPKPTGINLDAMSNLMKPSILSDVMSQPKNIAEAQAGDNTPSTTQRTAMKNYVSKMTSKSSTKSSYSNKKKMSSVENFDGSGGDGTKSYTSLVEKFSNKKHTNKVKDQSEYITSS